MTNILKKIIFLFMLFVTFFIYSTKYEPEQLVINQHNLQIPHWHQNLDGIKIAVLSDLHIGSSKININKLEKIIETTNSLSPDLIFLVGDFDAMSIYHNKLESKTTETLSKLKSKEGIFAVLGNHDYEPKNIVKPILINAGISLLEDSYIEKEFNNTKFKISGIGDLWRTNPDIKKAIGKNYEPTIMLSHNPDIFPEIPSNISLTVSGHTHGGEVIIPFLGAPFVPSKYSHRYAKGHIIENNKHLFVTSGIATISHFRTFNPPEIVLLNLYSKTDNNFSKNKTRKGLNDLLFFYNKRKYNIKPN